MYPTNRLAVESPGQTYKGRGGETTTKPSITFIQCTNMVYQSWRICIVAHYVIIYPDNTCSKDSHTVGSTISIFSAIGKDAARKEKVRISRADLTIYAPGTCLRPILRPDNLAGSSRALYNSCNSVLAYSHLVLYDAQLVMPFNWQDHVLRK